ncbi:hypothetical protein NEMBOFW57_009455 [Staphylotrichum longicolle]|uniref:Uncharacterized protein n=1 Tax=Staphylotrichum longicolle TaxID=669026 RepID=A0AAD4EPI2_9PEZI|nr:hypothetical protein NEMBOFW57_009455 [Staphylotrichum longicolle]
MQLKLALRTLATTAFATTALAMPSSPPAAAAAAAASARDNGMPAPPINYDIETTETDDIHWPRDDSSALLETRAPTKWQAAGGCRTDWGGNCLNKCKAEAPGKGNRVLHITSPTTVSMDLKDW